jgi:hypothetical protein
VAQLALVSFVAWLDIVNYSALCANGEMNMRAFFAMLAAAMAAAMTCFRWVRDASGRLIMTMVGGSPMLAAMPAMGEDEPAQVDQGYGQLRAAAEAMSRGAVPSPEAFDALGHDNVRWLAAMEPTMLRKVVEASDEDLGRHMRGIKSIRGLLAYDRDSVDAYIEARMLEREAARDRGRRNDEGYEPDAPAYAM